MKKHVLMVLCGVTCLMAFGQSGALSRVLREGKWGLIASDGTGSRPVSAGRSLRRATGGRAARSIFAENLPKTLIS